MSKHYYEAFGELRKRLREMHEKRQACYEAMYTFAEKHGTATIGIRESMHVEFVLIFDPAQPPPDPNVWKQVKNCPGQYKPRLGNKAGKQLNAEMQAICKQGVSGATVGELIKLRTFGTEDGQLVWRTPGMRIRGQRVLLTVPSNYKVPTALEKQLKRISDLAYERLAAEKSKRKVNPNRSGASA